MESVAEFDTVSTSGKTFLCKVYHDNDAGVPWASDGCLESLVSGWTGRSKRPHEYVLNTHPCGGKRYFDAALCRQRALDENWDAEPFCGGTRKQQAARAVSHTFEYLRGWVRDEWFYAYIVVSPKPEDGEESGPTPTESIGGVEYVAGGENGLVKHWAQELANELESRIELHNDEEVV